jgi:putative cell wall-binding protein
MLRRLPPFAALVALVASTVITVAPPAQAGTRGPIRIAGQDRYDTAARVSSAAFNDGAEVVVLASGESFPDGLAAGPLAALKDAPVLLTAKAELPEITGDELERLEPEKVIVVGGPAAVDDAVLAQIEALLDVKPSRIAGATRYDTATAVASLFPAGGPIAFVANGVDFPDALAGGAAAAIAEAPLLLTPPDALPPATGDELARLAPAEVLALGGSSAISDAVVTSIDDRVPGGVRRLAGTDRYGTAAAIAADRVGDADEVIVATGESFPDALAAAPLARANHAPILLTAGCQPPATTTFIRDRDWAAITAVGGTGAVPELGLSQSCTPVPDGEIAEGLTLQTGVLGGPVVVRIIGITRRAGWDVRATTATGNVIGRLGVTDIARRLDSPVAVNGTFFNSDNGDPSYALAVDGRLLKAPGGGGTVLGLDPTNPDASFFATPQFDITLGDIAVDRVNSGAPGGGEVGMFTREYNKTVDVGSSYCRAELSPDGGFGLDSAGSVTQTYEVGDVDCSSASIETQHDDIVAALEDTPEGDAIADLSSGDSITYTWRVHPDASANGVSVVMGGNIRLVIGNQVASDVTGNTGSFFTKRAARTAVCFQPSGVLQLVVVDGGGGGYSTGWTPRELADYLVSIGCLDALNLDGGGSTALAINGMLVNRPSGPPVGQRPVGSALFLSPSD